MKFVVFRCSMDQDFFIVTDEARADQVSGKLCPNGGEVEKVGEFDEMGSERLAFDETIAKNSIEEQGFYRFEARTWAPGGTPPGTMPG